MKNTSIIALVLCAGFAGHAVAQSADEPVLSNAAELPEFMMPSGPNAGSAELPKPHLPEPSDKSGEMTAHEHQHADAVHLSLGLDVTNAYFSRGLRQEDKGVLWQPWATVGFDLVDNDDWSLQAFIGTWNSLHSKETGSSTDDSFVSQWYEADAYGGLTAGVGDWTLGVQYGFFASPNDAFTTVQELQFSVAYDDSEALGDWALAPAATLIFETGDGTSDGQDKGVYLQLSATPGFDIPLDRSAGEDGDAVAITFPVILSLSASDYYQDTSGDDNFFGALSVGAKATFPLPIADRFGDWSAYVGANVLFLGDTAKAINDDDSTALVASAGFAVTY